MSKKHNEAVESTTGDGLVLLKGYRIPLKGELVFACQKCQKKLKKTKGSLSLKKVLKKEAKHGDDRIALRVVPLACLKLCPKEGIAVSTQAQIGASQCSIVRTAADAGALYRRCISERDQRRPAVATA